MKAQIFDCYIAATKSDSRFYKKARVPGFKSSTEI
jgi:hypothetical protein